MAFEISWEDAAEDIRSFDTETQKRIIKKIRSLAENPFHYAERLVGYPFYKLHVGDYRVILDIRQDVNKIIVILIGHRSKVYKEFTRHFG